RCDTIHDDGTPWPSEEVRGTYSYAQKMRAAMTYAFGHVHGIGTVSWHRSEVTGRMVGNPSVSPIVSRYMLSLRRRKVRAGETTTSARAITPEILRMMYDFNHHEEFLTPKLYAPQQRKKGNDPDRLDNWGGCRTRRAMQLAYVLSFLCLLRFDEVLHIRMEDIEFSHNKEKMIVTLPFRKTAQFGDIKPFILYEMPDEPWLCPHEAFFKWIVVRGAEDGYLFPTLLANDRIDSDLSEHLSSEKFLELFHNNLIDVDVHPYTYGTHSFRRGGCQYLVVHRRWSIRRVCEWGGWSTEFTHLTIVKYLISWNDDPLSTREDFFNPNQAPAVHCYTCERSCHCG
ncbi:hypothetical protein FISHEDRAFT_39905, partial [Fistulina hepatica ATCC 64428]